MAQLTWRNLVGQDRVKQVLQVAFAGGTLGHAYLFCGQEGSGMFQAALELSMGLLCSSPEAPCYECSSCRKILAHAHPDFHFIFPLALAGEHKNSDGGLSEKGCQYVAALSRERIASPYLRIDQGKGQPVIPVDMIRNVTHAIQRGPVASQRCVVVFDRIDEMTTSSANALLKVLEEPPKGTYLLLLTSRFSVVLPTIVSRCQIVRFGTLCPERIEEELRRMRPESTREAASTATLFSMGSLGRALSLLDNPATDSETFSRRIWSLCAGNDWDGLVTCIDEMAVRSEFSFHEQFYIHGIHMIRELLVGKITPSEKYISVHDMPSWAEALDPFRAQELVRLCEDSVSALGAHGNARLILVNFVLSTLEMLHGKEYKAG